MTVRRASTFALAAAVLIGIAALFFFRPGGGKKNDGVVVGGAGNQKSISSDQLPPPAAVPPTSTAPAEAPSHLADALNASDGNVRRDLEIVNEVFTAWQTNFPHDGNPVGENTEITAALTGENRLKFAFIPRNHRAINGRGELCDRWGTPFRFHQISGSQMEIRSAGPDRKFATADDAFWPPTAAH